MYRQWAFLLLALALAHPCAAADPPTARPLDSEPLPTPAPGGEEPAQTLPPTVAVCHDGSRCWTRPLAEHCATDGGRVFRVVLGDAKGRDANAALIQCRAAAAAPPRDLPQRPGTQSH
jgi:hypothetical protein